MTTFIYSISDENGDIRYIGKSNNPKNRLYKHLREKSNMHKYNWLKSIVKRGYFPVVEIIDEVPLKDWERYEIYWISQFKAWGFNLINLTIGGEGGNGYKHTESARKKMRKSKLGSKLSEEHKQNIAKSIKEKSKKSPNYNKCYDKIHFINKEDLYQKYIIDNLSIPKCSKYFKVSEKVIFNNLKDYKIIKPIEDWKGQLASHPKKILLQYDLDGNLLKEFSCVESAEKELKIKHSNIANCCRGLIRISNGYIWRYKDEFIPIKPIRRKNYNTQIIQYDLNMNEINKFKSIADASRKIGISRKIIDRGLKKILSSDKFIFKQIE